MGKSGRDLLVRHSSQRRLDQRPALGQLGPIEEADADQFVERSFRGHERDRPHGGVSGIKLQARVEQQELSQLGRGRPGVSFPVDPVYADGLDFGQGAVRVRRRFAEPVMDGLLGILEHDLGLVESFLANGQEAVDPEQLQVSQGSVQLHVVLHHAAPGNHGIALLPGDARLEEDVGQGVDHGGASLEKDGILGRFFHQAGCILEHAVVACKKGQIRRGLRIASDKNARDPEHGGLLAARFRLLNPFAGQGNRGVGRVDELQDVAQVHEQRALLAVEIIYGSGRGQHRGSRPRAGFRHGIGFGVGGSRVGRDRLRSNPERI